MFLSIQETLKTKLRAGIREHFGLEFEDVPLEHPPNVKLGDFAAPVAFELAKRLKAATGTKHNPRQLAETLRGAVLDLPEIERVEVAGAGYLNFFLKRAHVFLESLKNEAAAQHPFIGGKLIVEHTSVNPNKAAHIGHLRNSVLGDTLVRLLRACGERVEIQNYIDNTGVQVADVVVGFEHIDHKTLADIERIPGKFDDHCWDLYAKVGRFYEEDKERLKLRAAALHAIEAGEGETARVAEHVAMRVLKCHLDTMWRLGIRYDAMPRESEVLHMKFWDAAFERLKAAGAVVHETEGRNKGCWVMPADEAETASEKDEESEHDADKILVRSNGTVNYTGKDIAYHLWKLGQLGMDFHYRPFYAYPDGQTVWISTPEAPAETPEHAAFGNGDAYFNVIDVGQSYAQHYVKKGVLSALSDPDQVHRVERSSHLSYEKVALTPASCAELGFELSEEEKKRTFINMAGRKGLGVKADDLMDRLEANALAHVRDHQPELSDDDHRDIARTLAVGALRYFLLKYTRNTVIAFDFKEAMKEQGETGIYLQYSLVRPRSIYRKLEEDGVSTDRPLDVLAAEPEKVAELLSGETGDAFWEFAGLALRFEEVLRQAAELLEPAAVAKYAFQLAQGFSSFYSKRENNIRAEADPVRRQFLIGIVKLFERQLRAAAAVMGIEAPAKM